MTKTEVRKVYERPALVEIGSMAEITEFGSVNRQGYGQGHSKSNGRGHVSHGNGRGLGHHKDFSEFS